MTQYIDFTNQCSLISFDYNGLFVQRRLYGDKVKFSAFYDEQWQRSILSEAMQNI